MDLQGTAAHRLITAFGQGKTQAGEALNEYAHLNGLRRKIGHEISCGDSMSSSGISDLLYPITSRLLRRNTHLRNASSMISSSLFSEIATCTVGDVPLVVTSWPASKAGNRLGSIASCPLSGV